MKREYSAGIILYRLQEHNALFLLLKYGAGHWDLPKGHREQHENTQETAMRELTEETGITDVTFIAPFEESFHYFFKNKEGILIFKEVCFLLGYTHTTTVCLSEEHTDYAWLSYKDALNQLTYDNAKTVLKKAYKKLRNQPLDP